MIFCGLKILTLAEWQEHTLLYATGIETDLIAWKGIIHPLLPVKPPLAPRKLTMNTFFETFA